VPLSRRRELTFRAIAVTIGVILPLALVEGLAAALVSLEKRRHEPEPPVAVAAGIPDDHHVQTTPDPYLLYRMQPNLDSGFVRTNAYGLREGPIEPTPAPDALRILFLGGSVAWGYDSKDGEDTVPSLLEAELARRADGTPGLRGRRIEVLNGGVPGYVAWQEALLYAIHLRELRPRWIVTLDGTNDAAAALHSGVAGAPMRWGTVQRAYLAAHSSLWGILWSRFVSGVQDLKVAKLVEVLRPRPVEARDPPSPADVAAALRGALEHLSAVARPEGAGVLTALQPMTILPDTKPLTDYEAALVAFEERRMPGSNRYYAESFEAIRGELGALDRARPGFSFLDATRVFSATPEPTFTDHCHLTPLGRQILARQLADRLVELLDAPASPRTEGPAAAASGSG